MRSARYKFQPQKARAAIAWMLQQHGCLDLHTVLKACYFADKTHLNEHLKPIFGANYRAMRFGPVPLEIYEMAKCESLWLSELGDKTLPWYLDGFNLRYSGGNEVDLSSLSDENIRHLREAVDLSRSLTFTERTAATHGKDWQAANLGIMRYEDMIDDSDEKDGKLEFMRDTAAFTKL